MTLMPRKKTGMRTTSGMVLLLFLATTSPGIGWVPAALATVQQDLERAQDLYDFAEFQQAMDLVTSLIAGGQLTETQKRDAYVIRARSAVGLGLTDQAQEDFCGVHQLDQTWNPDPVMFPKDEVDAFNAAVLDCQVAAAEEEKQEDGEKKPFYMKPVVWAAAAGAVILGVVLAGGGSDDETPPATEPALDDFPEPPTN
jgi:hypothetical protein